VRSIKEKDEIVEAGAERGADKKEDEIVEVVIVWLSGTPALLGI
jgi:hypothetical protein